MRESLQSWIITDFKYGEIQCETIKFSLDNHNYIMFFNRVDEAQDDDAINEMSKEFGIKIKKNSYQVKFDTQFNFDNDSFYTKPRFVLSRSELKKLSRILIELLHYHLQHSRAEAYLFAAADSKLKRFYDNIAKEHKDILKFKLTTNLGKDGYGYELTT